MINTFLTVDLFPHPFHRYQVSTSHLFVARGAVLTSENYTHFASFRTDSLICFFPSDSCMAFSFLTLLFPSLVVAFTLTPGNCSYEETTIHYKILSVIHSDIRKHLSPLFFSSFCVAEKAINKQIFLVFNFIYVH